MKKSLLKIDGTIKIKKKDQKLLNGGFDLVKCYDEWILCPIAPGTCFVVTGAGTKAHGYLRPGGFGQQCCA